MKALALSSDDIQNFSKLIYDPKTAAQLASSAVAAAAAGGVTVSGGGVASHNVVGRSLATDSSNLMALQYYLKHPANNYAVATSNAPTVAAHAQHQQLLAQSQTQLKQLQLKQPTIHQQQHGSYHHHPYYQQNSASSSIVLATPTHTITISGHHCHNQQQQQQQQHHHHQQQQQQQHHHHHHSQNQSHTTQQQQAVLPVHALNQNSNFSAASSSTGGGTTTTSSQAPTQQSNSSSISPTAQRNTPANNNNSNNSKQQQQQQHHHNNLNQSTSASTVAAANALLRANGSSTSTTSSANCAKKIKTEPLLSAFNQSERLNFANTHIGWSEDNWKRVIFQDERKFNLDGPDGFSYYFHDLRNYERMLSQRPRGNSVYIYLLITVGGPIHLEVTTAKLKPETCIETILRERPSIVSKLGGNTDFILQDHNWMSNALPTAQDWLNAEGLKTQKWPTIAHDLNIMENIWGWLIREVFDGGRKFSRKDDLIFRIREAWARLPIDLITNLYTTLPERITELYYTRGVYTNC